MDNGKAYWHVNDWQSRGSYNFQQYSAIIIIMSDWQYSNNQISNASGNNNRGRASSYNKSQ